MNTLFSRAGLVSEPGGLHSRAARREYSANESAEPSPAVSVLCVSPRSIYKHLDVDAWDKHRDAFQFAGPNRLVAHPPCRVWSQLRHFVRISDSAYFREICLGLFCAAAVKEFGGILEQPSGSGLWSAADLPLPGCAKAPTRCVVIDQRWFGHPCRKTTWLYVNLQSKSPPLPYRLDGEKSAFDRLSAAQRSHTPPAFAKWLIAWCAQG